MDHITNRIINGEKNVPTPAPLSGIGDKAGMKEWCGRYPGSFVSEKVGVMKIEEGMCGMSKKGEGKEKGEGDDMGEKGKEKGERLLSRFEVRCRESGYREKRCRKFVGDLVGVMIRDGDEDGDKEDLRDEVKFGVDDGRFLGNTFPVLYQQNY